MFKKVFILLIFSIFSTEAQVEDIINSFINKNQQSLSNEDISNGLKQALEISTIIGGIMTMTAVYLINKENIQKEPID